jgi:ABC-type sugar transport system substrate-binding protein
MISQEAKALGISYTETGPTSGSIDVPTMITQIEMGIADKYGAIITFPASPGMSSVFITARKHGIIVATIDGPANDGANVNIGASYLEEGAAYEQAAASRPGPQYVGMLVQSQTGPNYAWVTGFKAAAKNDKNMHIVGTVYTNDDASVALADSEALLTAHPQINVLASPMGTVTAGATAAIKSRHLVGKVVFLANGTADGGIQGLEDGTCYRVMVQDLPSAGKSTVTAVVAIAAGKKVPYQINWPIKMVGLSNYKQYVALGWQ